MAKRRRSPAESYHDRVANIYDQIYDGSPYWELYRAVTWRHLRRFLPQMRPARVLDVGCGSGYWGLRLLKSGFEVDFLDISQKMLDQVGHHLRDLPQGAASNLIHASIDDLSALSPSCYDLIVGQGDPLSCAQDARQALREMTRLLRPGGMMVQSVDNRHAGYDHFLERGDLEGLSRFLRDGKTEWLTDKQEERFGLTMFTPAGLQRLFARQGYEVLSVIGKTVLPWRLPAVRRGGLLEANEQRRRAVELEERLHAVPALLGRAPHLEIAARWSG